MERACELQVLNLWGVDSGCFGGMGGNIPSQVASHLVLWC
jgi:hypothetical protein